MERRVAEELQQPSLLYNDPHDTLELVACELAKILGILAGIGATPFLRERLERFWLAGVAAGGIVIAVGLVFLARRYRRERPGLFQGLRELPGRLLNGLRRGWAWIRAHLPGQRKASTAGLGGSGAPLPQPAPAAAGISSLETASAQPATTRPAPAHPLVLLPYLTVLIGLFILVPAAATSGLQNDPILNLDLIAIYFSAPAILIWAIGEVPYFFSKAVVRPKNAAVIAGILKSGLQVLSAILFWVFLGLAIGMQEFTWMLWGASALALAGLVLCLVSEAGERRRLNTQPKDSR